MKLKTRNSKLGTRNCTFYSRALPAHVILHSRNESWTLSLGGRRLALASQPELVENVRWTDNGVVFATVHLIGSANRMRRCFPARTAGDDAEARRRTEAAAAWMRDTISAATASNASAVVIALHGNPFDGELKYREPFQPFLITLLTCAHRRCTLPIASADEVSKSY